MRCTPLDSAARTAASLEPELAERPLLYSTRAGLERASGGGTNDRATWKSRSASATRAGRVRIRHRLDLDELQKPSTFEQQLRAHRGCAGGRERQPAPSHDAARSHRWTSPADPRATARHRQVDRQRMDENSSVEHSSSVALRTTLSTTTWAEPSRDAPSAHTIDRPSAHRSRGGRPPRHALARTVRPLARASARRPRSLGSRRGPTRARP